MKKGYKALIAVCIDLVLLILIAVSVYMLLFHGKKEFVKLIFTVLIVAAIPAGFYLTYLTFAGDKYTFENKEFEDDFDEPDEADESEEINETKINEEK